MDRHPLLTVSSLSVSAGGKRLLDDVSFGVEKGELVGLSGPSGCGKSTLLRAIAGLIDPLAGESFYYGRTPQEMGWASFRGHAILVAQQPALLDDTVEANLARPFTYKNSEGTYSQEKSGQLLDTLGVGRHRLNQPAKTLSIGQQQRVCLVRALLLEPSLLLLDEPTGSLDEANVSAVEWMLKEWVQERGAGALVVTHDLRQVERCCSRGIDLRRFASTLGKEVQA